MAQLNKDIWNIVFDLLPPPDLLSLALTSKSFSSVILRSRLFKRWRALCPAKRKPLAMTWEQAWYINEARSEGLTGDEPIYRDPDAAYTEEDAFDHENPFPGPKLSFPGVILETQGAELIDLAGLMSARDGTTQYIAEMESRLGVLSFPRAVNSWRVDLKNITKIEPGIRTALPPERHLVRPSGEQLVGGTLLWIDDIQSPLNFTLTEVGITFHVSPEGGRTPSPFEFSYMTSGDEPVHSPYSEVIVHWLNMMTPPNQMFSGVSALKNRGQKLYVYDVFEKTLKIVNVRDLLGNGIWSAPWILPMGSDNKGNLVVKIVDSDTSGPRRRVRLIQRNFNMNRGKIRCSLPMYNAVTSTPWDSHLFNDHCCGYVYHKKGELYAQIHDLETGKFMSIIGPFPTLLKPEVRRWQCILTSFFLIFQDRSKAIEAPSNQYKIESNPTPMYFYKITTGKFLYTINPPSCAPAFEPPRSWIHRGEDAGERYVLLNGVGALEDVEHVGWPEDVDGAKKWLILDTVRKEWIFVTSTLDRWRFSAQGMHVLYRMDENDDSIQGLRFKYARINIPVQ